MKNKLFIAVLLVCSAGICGMFYLIFQRLSAMMVCCAASGLLFLWSVFLHVFIVSDKRTVTVRNSSLVKILDASSFLLVAWTLLFIFAFGSYEDIDRDLTVLYVGYIVLAVIALTVCLMAGRGGSVSEAGNRPVQHNIQEKESLLKQLYAVSDGLNGKSGSQDDIRQLSRAIDMMRNTPARAFEDNAVCSRLHECIGSVTRAAQGDGNENMSLSISKLIMELKTNTL